MPPLMVIGRFCPVTTETFVALSESWLAPACATVTYTLGQVVVLPTWQSVIVVEPAVFPETLTLLPLILTFAIEGFELLETYKAVEPIFVAVILAEEPASSTMAFWLKESAFAEVTVGQATVGDFGPLVPFNIAVTSVPEVRP